MECVAGFVGVRNPPHQAKTGLVQAWTDDRPGRRVPPDHPFDEVGRRLIADCIDDPAKAGREHQVGGPDIFSFREIGMLAADVLGRPYQLKIRKIPVWSLRLVAALASAAGRISRASRRTAALLQWMIWSGTHDAVAAPCGERRLRDAFCSKRDTLPLRAISEKRRDR